MSYLYIQWIVINLHLKSSVNMNAKSLLSFFIGILLIHLNDGQNGFTNYELTELLHLKDYVCGFSTNEFNASKYDPWFCVLPQNCDESRHDKQISNPVEECIVRFPHEGRDKCCYMGYVKTFPPQRSRPKVFTADPVYWGIGPPASKDQFDEYWKTVYNSTFSLLVDVLQKEVVCNLLPSELDEMNNTMYMPYICKTTLCLLVAPDDVKVGLDKLKRWHTSQSGNKFCSTNQHAGYCCHPAVAIPVESTRLVRDYADFHVRVLPTSQKYAPGFRSSFKCEQYSKLVCEGKKDRCSSRILDRTVAVPGEIPHQALVGIQQPMTRLFHCAGSLVSRYYVLSAVLCRFYDGVPASVVLLGEYNFYETEEFGQKELTTYISEVAEEPTFTDNEHQYRQSHLLLFRLWRPVTFHYWLRPACINWKVAFRSRPEHKVEFPEEAVSSGFGMVEFQGRWNKTLKRFYFPPDTCVYPNRSLDIQGGPNYCEKCGLAFYNVFSAFLEDYIYPNREKMDINEAFCLSIISNYSIVPDPTEINETWAPCQFDMGSPASAMERNTTPYCQWKLFGVNVNPRWDCLYNGPSLFRVVGGMLLPWLEEAIWSEDFFVHEIDLRYPTCHNKNEETFKNMAHLNVGYDRFYTD